MKPVVVTLCGSTKAGKIVLTIGCDTKSDDELFGHLSANEFDEIKIKLDELHKRKIDISDEVLIINIGGYIGASTRSELDYAIAKGKRIRYLETDNNQLNPMRG